MPGEPAVRELAGEVAMLDDLYAEKSTAGGRWKPEPLLRYDEVHEAGGAEDVGETGSEPAFSISRRRHACEQYAPLEDCRSQARQKSGVQSISDVMVEWSKG